MNLERASQRAGTVRGPKRAARLYNDIEYELALGEPDNHLERVGEQALALLEQRFPGAQHAAREVEEPPSLSRRAGDALYGMNRAPPTRRPARRSKHHLHRRVRRSRGRVFANVRAHPVATVTLFIIVIVHFWAYIVVGVIALAALKTVGRLR